MPELPVNDHRKHMDYSQLLDEQVLAFIEKTNAAFAADTSSLSVQDQRQLYDAMCQALRAEKPHGIKSTDRNISGKLANGASQSDVTVRQYTRDQPLPHALPGQLVYVHGGGFVMGGLDSHDDICAEITHHTGIQLTSVDYRLSPEHKHPAALQDVMLAVESIWNEYRHPIVLCGDSAGATLCAATCHALRSLSRQAKNAPLISGQVLIYPGLGGDTACGSYITHANAPMLSTQEVMYYSSIRCHDEDDRKDPLFAPLREFDFTEIPPSVVFSAECDPLSDDGKDYCQHIVHAGGKAHWLNELGLVHGYLRARHSSEKAGTSFERIILAIKALAENRWPYP